MKRVIISVAILLGILAFVGVLIVAGALFYSYSNTVPNERTTPHAGISFEAPITASICYDDDAVHAIFSGPNPRGATCAQKDESGTPALPVFTRINEGVSVSIEHQPKSLPSAIDCPSHFSSGTKRKKGRKIAYVLCSKGGGSGGQEYTLFAKTNVNDQPVIAVAYTQEEWGQPGFVYVFHALATLEIHI